MTVNGTFCWYNLWQEIRKLCCKTFEGVLFFEHSVIPLGVTGKYWCLNNVGYGSPTYLGRSCVFLVLGIFYGCGSNGSSFEITSLKHIWALGALVWVGWVPLTTAKLPSIIEAEILRIEDSCVD